jgi:hypothetical protein
MMDSWYLAEMKFNDDDRIICGKNLHNDELGQVPHRRHDVSTLEGTSDEVPHRCHVEVRWMLTL